MKRESLCSHYVPTPCTNTQTRVCPQSLCLWPRSSSSPSGFIFASPNIWGMKHVFYLLYFHFDRLNCFCFFCEVSVRTKQTAQLHSAWCTLQYFTNIEIFSLFLIKVINHSLLSRSITHHQIFMGSYYVRGAILETGHTKIKINMYILIGLWHRIISSQDDFRQLQEQRKKGCWWCRRALTFDINIQTVSTIYQITLHTTYWGHYTEENEVSSVPFEKEQISHCLIRM